MDLVPSQPVEPVNHPYPPRKQRISPGEKKPTDSKVRGFFFSAIQKVGLLGEGGLLPSAAASLAMRELLSALTLPVLFEEGRKSSRDTENLPLSKRLKRAVERRIGRRGPPSGLRRCKPHGWINAFMQFLLFMPRAAELFCTVPRRFHPIRQFIDQYFLDQEEERPLSLASGALLLRCLLSHLPSRLFFEPERIDLYAVLRSFLQLLFPSSLFADTLFYQTALFRPDWHIVWSSSLEMGFLEKAMEKKIEASPPELLIALQGASPQLPLYRMKKQFFPSSGLMYYDLDSFIECQFDDKGREIYITYLKVEGTWYQCDDERIEALLSVSLAPSLQRGVLLHYKRLSLRGDR